MSNDNIEKGENLDNSNFESISENTNENDL